jgi:hypothetical protein
MVLIWNLYNFLKINNLIEIKYWPKLIFNYVICPKPVQ